MDHAPAPENRTIDVDVEALDTRGRTLHGYAAVYGVESHDLGGFREKIAPGAFASVLDADVRCLLNHDPSQVLGRSRAGTLRLADEQRGLRFECDLPDSPLGENVRQAVKRGDVDGASFRFVIGNEEWDGETRTVKAVSELHDVTVATYGAYPDASVELRTRPNESAHGREEDNMETDTETITSTGGLAVEDRTASAGRSTEERVIDALREVRKGESRALTTSATISPGELSTVLFEKLRASSVALRSGIRVLTTDKDSVLYPALTADVSPSWYAEAAPITPGDPTFSSVTATPRKLAHLVQMSNEVIDDSDPSIVDVLNTHLLRVLALKLDVGLFEGSGTPPEIRGLRNVSGIQTVAASANGDTFANLDKIADAIGLLEAVNTTATAIVMAPRTFGTIRKLKDADNRPLLGESTVGTPRTIFGVPVYVTGQLSTTETQGTATNASSIYVYNAAEIVYVRRSEIELELDRSRLFNSDQSELSAKLRGDLIVPNPSAVVRIPGLIPA